MKIAKRAGQVFCRHNYVLFANIYGDLINDLNARTIYICKKCGKRKFEKDYKEAPVNYNKFLQDCATYKKTGDLNISSDTIRDTKQYKELFGPKTLEDVWDHRLNNER